MRIKDLATRATKLLTGSAYMVFDNGTKVEKVDYAELAKQIITEYNTQTLAGSAQSVKSALDALNSNKQNFSGVINDTRLPSSNQQIENVSIGQSRNIMYVGNNDTINELIFQSADTGSFSLSNLYKALGVKMKETTVSGGEITFTFTGSRYNAILMIQSNSFSSSGIYGLIFKKDSGSSIKSLVGNESLPTIDNNGSITFNAVSWSRAVLYTTAGDEFS